MANTYTLIASQTLSGATASVTFSSIPATYTDLLLKFSIRSDATSGDSRIEFNGSGGTAYTGKILYADGSTAASASHAGQAYLSWGGLVNRSTTTSNTFANNEFYIPNYAGSNYKSVSVDGVEENNATQSYSELSAGLWSNTAAITSIKLTPSSGNYVQYSTFYLYGIKNS